ncbi:MAG: oligopeptide transporter, OPT family [Gammaproteobacteria bacterium]|nr:oligopeptide transporter, OPT family [Gammaproteobacteria bacterium]
MNTAANTATPPPQLTVKAILLGIALAMILAGANAYLGLFAGLTVSASIPAAVISMGILKLFKNSNILENNIVQTSASAGESLAAGAIFTLPALILLGYWEVFDYWWVCAIAGLGGLLGVLFTIPLRRSLIIEQALPFPEGTATAEVLRAGDKPGAGLKILGVAALTGGLVKFAETGLKLWPATAQTGGSVGNTVFYAGANVSPALLSVGYIVGLNIAALVFIGGFISWGIAIPIYSTWFMEPELAAGKDSVALAYTIWSNKIRYLGVGAMLVGGIWALISIRGSVFSGIRSGLVASRRNDTAERPHTEHDTPMKFVLVGVMLLVIPIFLLYNVIAGATNIALAMTLVMIIAGFLFSAVAGYMAGLVGSSNNPVSGITIATILSASLLLLWLAGPTSAAAAAAIMIGAVVCCSAAIAGDNMQDLKAGYLLGATPWKQQLMQAIGVISAVLVMAPVLNLLLAAYGIGPATEAQPNSLAAPQATLMASVAEGVLGGELPWNLILIGAAIGVAIIATDEYLRVRGAAFRAPILAVAVGIYLPFELAIPIFAGGLISWLSSRRDPDAARKGPGVLFAAGLITGEALIGILMAIPIVLSGRPDVLAAPDTLRMTAFASLAALCIVAAALWRVSVRLPQS